MTYIYNQMTKGELSSSIKRTERQIDSELAKRGKDSNIVKIWRYSLENRVAVYAQRFGELPV